MISTNNGLLIVVKQQKRKEKRKLKRKELTLDLNGLLSEQKLHDFKAKICEKNAL